MIPARRGIGLDPMRRPRILSLSTGTVTGNPPTGTAEVARHVRQRVHDPDPTTHRRVEVGNELPQAEVAENEHLDHLVLSLHCGACQSHRVTSHHHIGGNAVRLKGEGER